MQSICKSRPFGPATIHGGANTQYPTMHGGRVGAPRGARLAGLADIDPATGHGGLADPATHHGGLATPPCIMAGCPLSVIRAGPLCLKPRPPSHSASPRRRARTPPCACARSRAAAPPPRPGPTPLPQPRRAPRLRDPAPRLHAPPAAGWYEGRCPSLGCLGGRPTPCPLSPARPLVKVNFFN